MYRLIEFIRRIYVVLLFIVIETVALYYYSHSTQYTEAKILSHAHSVTGALHSSVYGVIHFFSLRRENQNLSERVAWLENQLTYYRERNEELAVSGADSLIFSELDSLTAQNLTKYRYMNARVIANSTNRLRNYITLNRGLMHGVVPHMGVITPNGMMVGYVAACSERYSVVIPLLNADYRTSGKIVGDDHIGSIRWNGHSPYKVEMDELSKNANIEVGDEVIGSGVSHYFPSDVKIKIGYIDSYTLNESQTAYNVVIRLASDLSRLSNVILIENADFKEVTDLEESVKNGSYLRSMSIGEGTEN
ncbi:MAG: rod shape-determining protein MreC [Alistipes sp.]|nr:rod shape-determining protein MreC [Alistipes sp.]